MTRQTTSAHSWPAIIALMLAALSLNVAAAPCDPDESKWVPSRYYPAGAVVHHDGEWYQSRELHEGLEPGITFDWKQLDSAPECSGERSEEHTSELQSRPHLVCRLLLEKKKK